MSEDLSQEVGKHICGVGGLQILVPTSGQGLDRSQVSDWVTGLSASQPWPAEMGVCGWGLGRCHALTRADRTAKCQRVSLSLLLCLILSLSLLLCLLLPPCFSTIYYQTGTQRQVSQAFRNVMNEFMVCSDEVFFFFFFQIFYENLTKR